MESRNGGASSSQGVLIPGSEYFDDFQRTVLDSLQSAYLYEESKQFFNYKPAIPLQNPQQEERYNAFRAKRRKAGYSVEDLKESYGFLLFDDDSKAKALGETGLLNGNSTCTTLGDPSKGVYISMYSDCLDPNRWYHGKSGFIVILKLTKGKVKKVSENYTQNLTEPTVGFDCHVSEQLPSVSANTSSFLAFERTQYYIYELLDDGSHGTAQSPNAACPFAVVSFSYMDTNRTLVPEEKSFSEVTKQVSHYFPWRGQLQIDDRFYRIKLKSTSVAAIPGKLAPVIKVNKAMSMSVLRQLLPKAVFQSSFTEEVHLDGFYCSLCEFVASEEEKNNFTLLLSEIREKNLAFCIPLNDCGILILLHSTHFLRFDDNESTFAEVLQGLFVFPESRVVRKDIKFGQEHSPSSDVLRFLPVLSYAEGEVEKASTELKDDLCDVLTQHMQDYATLINPGFPKSPSRPSKELSMFPDQFDVSDVDKNLYSTPEWSKRTWRSFESYLSKPASFQLPVSKVSKILTAHQEEGREDLNDDVYICLSSPEAPVSPLCMDIENQLPKEKDGSVESSTDVCMPSAEPPFPLSPVLHKTVADILQGDDVNQDETDHTGVKGLCPSPTSEDLPTELILSITSADQRVCYNTLNTISPVTATKQFPDVPTFSKLQTEGASSLTDDLNTKEVLDTSQITSLKSTKKWKRRKRRSKAQRKVPKAILKDQSLQTIKSPVEVVNSSSKTDEHLKETDIAQFSNSSKPKWRKIQRCKHDFRKLSTTEKIKPIIGSVTKEKNISEAGQHNLGNTVSKDIEGYPLKKKLERWELKPVVSECRRILVPFGLDESCDQVKALKKKVCIKEKECLKLFLDATSENREGYIVSEPVVSESLVTSSSDIKGQIESVQVDVKNKQPAEDDVPVPSTPKLTDVVQNYVESLPLKPAQNKQLQTFSPIMSFSKGELLLSRLKSVLSKRKRKLDPPEEQSTTDKKDDNDSHVKKSKADVDAQELNSCNTSPQSFKKVSSTLSADPLFAYSLGLTPKTVVENVQMDKDAEQSEDSTTKVLQRTVDNQLQEVQKPIPIFPKRGRIKTLKRLQGIPAEHVKKKWWLHFQTPACITSEQITHNDHTDIKTDRMNVTEKLNSACSSTDALSLLANLALGACKDQIPAQPSPALEKTSKDSLKKCDHPKGISTVEQESVLHALLKNPVAKSIQPLEPCSPCHLLGGNELVSLISKEHTYSLPTSSSLLLDLSGTTFQVSPLNGSTRLLNYDQALADKEVKTLHSTVITEEIGDNIRTSESHYRHKKKFRHNRSFVVKEKSIQVTRKWQENYNFNLDSRFTSDPKIKVVVRALHGPWNFLIQDTIEEVRLIFHMWIGLFYSRSTSRFFQVEPTLMQPPSEESTLLKNNIYEVLPGSVGPDPKTYSGVDPSTRPDVSDVSTSNALDLSIKENTVLKPDSVILDLTVQKPNDEPVSSEQPLDKKIKMSVEVEDTHDTFKTLLLANEEQTEQVFQWYQQIVHCSGIIREVKDKVIQEYKSPAKSQKAEDFYYSHTSYLKVDGTHGSPKEIKCVPHDPQSIDAAFEMNSRLRGCSKDAKDVAECSGATDKNNALKNDLKSKFPLIEEVNSNEEENVFHSDESLNELEINITKNGKKKKSSYLEATKNNFLEVRLPQHDSSRQSIQLNNQSDITCNADVNEKKLSDESQTFSDKPDILDVGVESDCLRDVELDDRSKCFSVVDICSKDSPQTKMHDSPVTEECILECINEAQKHEKKTPSDGTEDELCNSVSLMVVKDNILSPCCIQKETALENKETTVQKNTEINETSEAELPMSENISSLNESDIISTEEDDIAADNQSKVSNINFSLFCNDQNGQDAKLSDREAYIDEVSQQMFPSECKVRNLGETVGTLTEAMDPKTSEFNKYSKVITYVGKGVAEVNEEQRKDEKEMSVSAEEPAKIISSASQPSSFHQQDSLCQIGNKMEISSEDMENFDSSKALKLDPSKFGNRSPTPTIDEKVHGYESCSSPNSSSSLPSDLRTCQSAVETNPPKIVSQQVKLAQDELTFETQHNLSGADAGHNPADLCSDVKMRTLRVLQSINKFLSSSNQDRTSKQIETSNVEMFLEQTTSDQESINCLAHDNNSIKSENKKEEKETSAVNESTLSQNDEKAKVTSDFQNKVEEVFDVKMSNMSLAEKPGLKQQRIVAEPHFHGSYIDEYKPGSWSHSNSTPFGLPPIVEEKLPISDKCVLHPLYSDLDGQVIPQNKQTHSTPTHMILKQKEESCKENDVHTTFLPNVTEWKSKSDKYRQALPDPPRHYKRKNVKFSHDSSSSSCRRSSEDCDPEYVHGLKRLRKDNSKDPVDCTTKDRNQKIRLNKSITSQNDDGSREESHTSTTQSSLVCTVFNTSGEKTYSLLDQLSQRCLQDDLTLTSVEKETLIFLEKMKNLLKKCKGGSIHKQDTHEGSTSCTSPLTVNFTELEEQEDSEMFSDISLDGQKIRVDTSDGKDSTGNAREGNAFAAVSQEASDPMEHAGISNMTAECAELYEAKMQDVCSAKKSSLKVRSLKAHQGHSRAGTSYYFNFCDQMKKELDDTFHSKLNAVVRKSCKTKYKFYMLKTSDNSFYKETKAYLESEGHAAVLPSEFFEEHNTSPLLIILRNEDIAEHVCKIPHLLKLKMAPNVLFAGIDEQDDIVNLTHQELFTRAGFVVFDRAVLEPLSLCIMKKITGILQELSKMGKWKWFLHYRDSRHLKENARLSPEENEKKSFMYWGQDTGILEVLPYHECDQMSKARPDYLTCLLRLQVQHISSRFSVFITDQPTDGAFEKNGILVTNLDSFLAKRPAEIFR